MTSLVHFDSGEILIERLLVRATFWGRFRGLLFHRNNGMHSAVLLISTKKVHTCGMLFAIDLYFFNSSMVLIGFRQCVKPWRTPPSPNGTGHILEVQHRGGAEPLRLTPGDKVSILWKLR